MQADFLAQNSADHWRHGGPFGSARHAGFPCGCRETRVPSRVEAKQNATVMTGLYPAGVVEAIEAIVRQQAPLGVPRADYMLDDASRGVVNFILSTVRRHHDWVGIRRPNGGSRP